MSMAAAATTAHYQQTTKSREAYEAQGVAFLHRHLAINASRRSRPQSAGAAGSWKVGRDRPGGSGHGAREKGFPVPPPHPPPVYYRSACPEAVADDDKYGRGVSNDHQSPPPPFSRENDTTPVTGGAANADGARLGKPRTRVRPSSANARVYSAPGAGQGVGGGGGGGGGGARGGREAGVQHPGLGAGGVSGKYQSQSSTAAHLGGKNTPSATFPTPPRPKSAVDRRRDTFTTPPSALAAGESPGVKVVPPERTARVNSHVDGRAPSAAAVAAALADAPRSEFRGADRRRGASSTRRAQDRPRPRSAVARVETALRHGKMTAPSPTPTAAAPRTVVGVTSKLKAAAAVVASATYRGSGFGSGSGSGSGGRTKGGKVGRTRVAPRPQSSKTRRSTAMAGNYRQRSDREGMDRVMARIFQHNRHWAPDHGAKERTAAAGDKKAHSNPPRRPQSACPPGKISMTGAQFEPRDHPKPSTWAPATPKKPSAVLAGAAAVAGATAKAATRSTTSNNSGSQSNVAGERGESTAGGATAVAGQSGAYARLFGMKRPGSHRRVGVDPLGAFKKEHYRSPSDAAVTSDQHLNSEGGSAGQRPRAKNDGYGQGECGGDGGGFSKPGKPDGEPCAVETQATVSTANTGSLTPQEGSSSAEGGRLTEEGGIRAHPPVKPLTKASAECCSPQERLYLRRLMLDLQGSARSSLDFYRLGKVVGEGSFAQVRVAWHKLTGQRVAVKTYEKAKIKDENQWKRISQEVKLMEKLNHPRVIRLFETAESSKRIHLVMEYADGGNLCSYVKRRKRLDEDEARRILQQLLDGVEYMHGVDIVHRDIKLENVLLSGNGSTNAKLVDFGFSANVKNRRRLHVFCGTPSYMAPEIIKRQEYDGKPVDIWSLGVVLYAMLCGCFPFTGPRYPELYKNISKGVFRLPDWLSASATSLVRGMLVTEPGRRLTLRQVCAHPWVAPYRTICRPSAGSEYRSAGGAVAKGGRSSPSLPDGLGGANGDGGLFSPVTAKKEGFHISNDPNRDMCAASVRKMEAFGADGEEITRQVLARRHSCLTTTFYLLKNEISSNGTTGAAARPGSAASSASSQSRSGIANARPASASGVRPGNSSGSGGARRSSSRGSSGGSNSSNRGSSKSEQRALAS